LNRLLRQTNESPVTYIAKKEHVGGEKRAFRAIGLNKKESAPFTKQGECFLLKEPGRKKGKHAATSGLDQGAARI